MRLAVVSPFVDRRHGTERALAELLERLARDYGCEIHLYAHSVDDLPVSGPRSERMVESPSSAAGAIFWHRVRSIPGPHLLQFLAWILFNGFLRRWHATVGGASYDLVVSPGINCLHPDVVIVHALFHRLRELSREENKDSTAQAGFFRRIHRRVYYGLLAALERRIYTDPRVTLAAVSKRMASLLTSCFRRENVAVVPNGVDTAYFSIAARVARRAVARLRRGFRDDDFVCLLIGNDWRTKGLSTILETLAVSPLSLRLLVVGNDSPEAFRARAIQLGVLDRCLWEPPSLDVLDFYAAGDVYVSPSREDSFGLPVAEAMACGLPAITSVFAGVSDYMHEGLDGFILRNPRDVQSLSQLLERFQAEPYLRRKVGEAAAKTALQWDWDRNAAAVWELLKSAKAKKHPAA